MSLCFGFLLPTRERIMEGVHDTHALLAMAERAESLGFDSLWVGDSLLAKPRHEPLTLLAAVAARTQRATLGTAVLLPVLRNPVILAHMAATVDRLSQGRLVLGVGIGADAANIRAEFEAAGVPFEQRVGRMLEGLRLCRTLWRGEPVTWQGRWTLQNQTLAPTPHRDGGPPIWIGSRVRAGMLRAGRHFDGWFPTGPDPASYREQLETVHAAAREAGRDPSAITAAAYLTMRIDNDAARANGHNDDFHETYDRIDARSLRRVQACFGGPLGEATRWLQEFVDAGVRHLVIRLAGDHERQMDAIVRIRESIRI